MSFLRNCWYVAGYVEEATHKPFTRTFLDEPVVIYRTEKGELVALGNRCAHRLAPLDRGKVINDVIECPYHGLQFNREGECVAAADGKSPPRAKVRAYPITERFQLLWIWMGEPALANPQLIADFAYLEDSDYGWYNGYIHTKANYQLVSDNLLDLSHTEFLHPLLRSDGWCARNAQTVEQSEDTVTVHNIALDDNILPIMRMVRPELAPVGKSIYQERWNAPGLIRLSVEYYSEGKQIIIPSGHFVTPESKNTTDYFVRSGHDWEPHNPAVTEGYGIGIMKVFQTEDIPIIEGQQDFLGESDLLERRPAMLKNDTGAIRARKLLAKKIMQEASGIAEKVG